MKRGSVGEQKNREKGESSPSGEALSERQKNIFERKRRVALFLGQPKQRERRIIRE